jgi:hypothetical protein
MIEDRMLRRLLLVKEEEVTERWRKLHGELLHNLISSPNAIQFIKERRMRLAGYVARMEAIRNACKILV